MASQNDVYTSFPNHPDTDINAFSQGLQTIGTSVHYDIMSQSQHHSFMNQSFNGYPPQPSYNFVPQMRDDLKLYSLMANDNCGEKELSEGCDIRIPVKTEIEDINEFDKFVIDAAQRQYTRSKHDTKLNNALVESINTRDLAGIKKCVEDGADVRMIGNGELVRDQLMTKPLNWNLIFLLLLMDAGGNDDVLHFTIEHNCSTAFNAFFTTFKDKIIVNFDRRHQTYGTPLEHAVRCDNFTMTHALLSRGVNMYENKSVAFRLACKNKNYHIFNAFIHQDYKVARNEKDHECHFNEIYRDAMESNNNDLVSYLLMRRNLAPQSIIDRAKNNCLIQ